MIQILKLSSGTVLALLCITACTSPRVALEQREEEIQEDIQHEAHRRLQVEEAKLSWDKALALLHENNLELEEARHRQLSSEEAVQRIFLDLLPAVNMTTSLSRALTDLGNVSSDDLHFSVFGFISVPGLVNLRTRYYSAVLQQIRAEWAMELKERELTIRLYELFVRQRILERRQISLRHARLIGARDPLENTFQQTPAALERETREWALTRERDALQAELSRLTGNYEALWEPLPETLPELGYVDEPIDLMDVDSYGVLARQLQAVELEGARLRELGVKLQYWPDLNVSLTSPPLYQISGGHRRDWNFDDVRLNLTSTLRLDTQLRTAYRLRDVRRQVEILHERLKLDNAQRLQRLETAARTLELARARMALTEFRLRALRETPVSPEPRLARDHIESILLLDEQLASLQLEIAQLEAIFWLVDDSRWGQESAED